MSPLLLLIPSVKEKVRLRLFFDLMQSADHGRLLRITLGKLNIAANGGG
jgi:hypothetical protein